MATTRPSLDEWVERLQRNRFDSGYTLAQQMLFEQQITEGEKHRRYLNEAQHMSSGIRYLGPSTVLRMRTEAHRVIRLLQFRQRVAQRRPEALAVAA